MQQITITEFGGNIAKHFTHVEHDRTGLIVTRKDHESCVLIPLSQWESMNETLHLLSNPHNADHIYTSLNELNAGKIIEVKR